MKAFSPAGMAVKGFLGPGPRAFDGAGKFNPKQPWGNFGNPLGKLSGNGNNAPDAGGGGGPFSGVFTLTANNVQGPSGFSDGVFDNGSLGPEGAVAPTALNGSAIGAFYSSFNPHPTNQSLTFGVYGVHVQTDFTQVSFTDQFGAVQSFLSSAAIYSNVPAGPGGPGAFWDFSAAIPSGAGPFFLSGNAYVITVT